MAISETFASTILKVSASFGFASFAVHPDVITAELGLEPDRAVVEGSRRMISAGVEVRAQFNSWSLFSTSGSKDVNDHIRELLGRLEGKKGEFRAEFGIPSFGVTWKGTHLYWGNGPFYEVDVLKGIAAQGAELFQDIYQVDTEDSHEPPAIQWGPRAV